MQTGYFKLVRQDGEVFPGTATDDFTVSATSDIHIGVVDDTATLSAALVLRPDAIEVAKSTTFVAPVQFAQVETNLVRAVDQSNHLIIVSPTEDNAYIHLDDVAVKAGTITATTVDVDTTLCRDAHDHVLRIGRDATITATSYVPGELKLSGFIPPEHITHDPQDDLDTTAVLAASGGVSLAVARAVVEIVTHPTTATRTSHIGNAEFEDYVRVSKILTVGDLAGTDSSVRYTSPHLSIDELGGAPGYVELNAVGFHDGSTSRVCAKHGGRTGAWDVLNVMQSSEVGADRPGIARVRGVILGDTAMGAGSDQALVSGQEGVSIVDVGDGSFTAYADLNLKGVQVWSLAADDTAQCGRVSLDADGVVDVDTRVASLGIDVKGRSDDSVVHLTASRGRLNIDAPLEPVALRLGGVDVSAADPDVAAEGINISEKLTVPTLRLGTDRTTSIELKAEPTTGALVLNSAIGDAVTLMPMHTSLDIVPGRIRLFGSSVDSATTYTELAGGDGRLALSVPELTLAGGMSISEQGSEMRLAGCERMVLDNCVLDATTPGALSITPARMRLVDEASGTHTELTGGHDALGLSVPKLVFAEGMTMRENGTTLALDGCVSVQLDQCRLDASAPNVLSLSSDTLGLGSKVAIKAESTGNVHIGPNADVVLRSDDTMTLQSADAVKLKLNTGSAWNEYAFTAHADGALILNGHDVDLIPKDVLSGSSGRPGTVTADGWWRTEDPVLSIKYAHRGMAVTRYPKLTDITFVNSVAQPADGVLPVVTNGFTGLGVDILLSEPRILRKVSLPRELAGQNDSRPTNWKVFGTEGKPTQWSAWEELGRAGFEDSMEIYTQTAYDGFRIVINSVSSSETLVNLGLQMFMHPPARDAAVQHSFTGSHLVAYMADERLEPGMLVSICQDGTLDSIARGGWKKRGGSSAIRIDSALPIVALTTLAKDKKVYGVFDSIVTNRWYQHGVDARARVNGLGEGAIWVCDRAGAIEAGDLLCSSDAAGYAMRQDDDAVRSCTVAKCSMSCGFEASDVVAHTLIHSAGGDVAWRPEPFAVEKSFAVRVLEDGTRCAYVACVYMCS